MNFCMGLDTGQAAPRRDVLTGGGPPHGPAWASDHSVHALCGHSDPEAPAADSVRPRLCADISSHHGTTAANKLCTGHSAHQGIFFAPGVRSGCLIQNVSLLGSQARSDFVSRINGRRSAASQKCHG